MSDFTKRLRQIESENSECSILAGNCADAIEIEQKKVAIEIARLRAENERTRSLLRWDIAEDDEGVILCDGDQERRFYHMSIVDALRAENEKLRAALKPFAEKADHHTQGAYWMDAIFTVDECRAAVKALEDTE